MIRRQPNQLDTALAAAINEDAAEAAATILDENSLTACDRAKRMGQKAPEDAAVLVARIEARATHRKRLAREIESLQKDIRDDTIVQIEGRVAHYQSQVAPAAARIAAAAEAIAAHNAQGPALTKEFADAEAAEGLIQHQIVTAQNELQRFRTGNAA